MSSSSDNTLRFLLYLFLISILFTFISSAEKSKCLPTEGKKWNYKKQKCVECPECGPGSFRNLSEQYKGREGEHGAERCIKCRPCPKGTYSSSGYGECSRCRLNCAEFHREVSEPCSSQHDAICGSCLTGYFDMYKNTLFPCAPNSERAHSMPKKPRLLPPQKKEIDKVPDKKVEVEDTNHVDGSVDQDTNNGQSDESSANREGETEPTTVIYGVIVSSVFAACLVGLLAGFLLKRRGISRPRSGILSKRDPVFNVSGHAPSHYSRVPRHDLSHDNDIEMDTMAHSGQSDASLYLQSEETQFQTTPVRAELSSQIDDQVRAELSQQCTSNRLDALGHAPSYYSRVPRHDLSHDNDIEMDTLAHTDQSDASLYVPSETTHFQMTSVRAEFSLPIDQQVRAELSQPCPTNHLNALVNSEQAGRIKSWNDKRKDICKCRLPKQCKCSKFTFPEDIHIDKSDKYVLEIATNICHDPFPLFESLKLSDADIYQEKSNRDIDPEKISQKTLVINLLHKWVERKTTPTTLRQLTLSLCEADFHSINEKLYNLIISNDSS